MYITELSFEVYRDTSMGDVEKAVNYVLDCLRYNGQVLGRELPVSMDGAILPRALFALNPIACIQTSTALKLSMRWIYWQIRGYFSQKLK